MGCGGSQFTEDENKFFKKPHMRDSEYLCNKIVNESSFTTVMMKKDLFEHRDDYMLKAKDGSDFLNVISASGRKRLVAMDGTTCCVLIFSVRYSEVNAVDAAFNLPHVYVYSTFPYKEGQKESDFEDDGKKLYLWARVHKVANVGTPKFEVAMAEFQGSATGPNIERFGFTMYTSIIFSDGRMEILKRGVGCCRVGFNEDNSEYSVTIAAFIDPALMISSIMAMESLKDR
mmetsp:Transcript_118384/g.368680  ORF Transcript_118384/g.368680 Transcript_118384/m.368680 type:complete len:230 (+) Transcript_118384:81-770(+)